MLHARLFRETPVFRDRHFQPTKSSLVSKEKSSDPPWLDGNPASDRPLFVQFCANKPDDLLAAAEYVAPYCDAVDLNLGCPQGIAKSGHYGSFLQEDWDTIYKMINKLHNELSIPVTAKMRILDTREKTLEYAKMILSAGASILTVHGRRREQKGHNTGLADWSMIRYLRDNLPAETVLFANGNILNSGDLEDCLAATGADAVMSAEANLSDPTVFAKPPEVHNPREYWYGPNDKGGYRMDAVFRRYLDIIHREVLGKEPPSRKPLYVPGDPIEPVMIGELHKDDGEKPGKKRKKGDKIIHDPNVRSMQGHLFLLLRPLISAHTDIRDLLAQTRVGDIDGFEEILARVEAVIRQGLDDYANLSQQDAAGTTNEADQSTSDLTHKQKTAIKYQRPWWVCQPYIRPLPEEAIKLGALMVSTKKNKAASKVTPAAEDQGSVILIPDDPEKQAQHQGFPTASDPFSNEVNKATLVCG